MTWHEVVTYIQSLPEFEQLCRDSFFTGDLSANCIAFENSDEFKATLKLIQKHVNGYQLMDVGAGNGIASMAFARNGFKVTALEPDISDLVGIGAIETVKEVFKVKDLTIVNGFFEDYRNAQMAFDIVYSRQCMHHAGDLEAFCESAYRALKPGGIFMTVRDHVVINDEDKYRFLEKHPLHKYYGGENAFKREEYSKAMEKIGFRKLAEYKHFESVINFAPQSVTEVSTIPESLRKKLSAWIGPVSENLAVKRLIRKVYDLWGVSLFDEAKVPGRLVTFIMQKPQ